LRERLREAIRTRELAGKIPGERELARRYGANAKTINKALSDLTSEGLLVRHVGRGTFVADGLEAGGASARKSCTYAWLTPSGKNSAAPRQELFEQAAELFRSKGHRLEQCVAKVDGSGELSEGSLSPGQLRGWDGIVLFGARPSSDLLADLYRRHLPLVAVNNHHERIRTALVVPDYAQGAFELCEHLIHLGHTAIGLLTSAELLPAAAAAASGYQGALQRRGLPVRPALTVDREFDWRRLFLTQDRPTAIICVGASLSVQAIKQAASAGLKLPTTLSVSKLPEPGESDFGGMEDWPLTAYEVPVSAVLRWATELLVTASPGQTPRTVIVPGRLIDRGSAAPPQFGARPSAGPPAEGLV
jgi:LacI family transcriptional regulator